MSASQIFLGILFGIIGMGYCYSGKRSGNMRLLGCGLALGVFPYFVDNIILVILIGIALTVFPIWFRGD
jgi:hypothetical protein